MQSRDTASVTVTSRRLMTVNGNVVRRIRVCYKTLCFCVTMNKNSVTIVTNKKVFMSPINELSYKKVCSILKFKYRTQTNSLFRENGGQNIKLNPQ